MRFLRQREPVFGIYRSGCELKPGERANDAISITPFRNQFLVYFQRTLRINVRYGDRTDLCYSVPPVTNSSFFERDRLS